MKKNTFAVIVGNRGFFPDILAKQGRKSILDVLKKNGFNSVALPMQETKYGAVETFNDAKKCASLFAKNAEKIERLDLPQTNDPLEHIAWRWVRLWTHWYDKALERPGSLPKVERIIEYMEDYGCDGVVFHSAFSCCSWHAGIVQQAQVLNKVYGNVPTLIMEGDIVDISSYNEVDTHNRIDAFIETVAASKAKA